MFCLGLRNLGQAQIQKKLDRSKNIYPEQKQSHVSKQNRYREISNVKNFTVEFCFKKNEQKPQC